MKSACIFFFFFFSTLRNLRFVSSRTAHRYHKGASMVKLCVFPTMPEVEISRIVLLAVNITYYYKARRIIEDPESCIVFSEEPVQMTLRH